MLSLSVVSDSLWPYNYSLRGSSVHGILQARILEWVAIPSSKGSSYPGIEPVSLSPPGWQAGSLPLALPCHCCSLAQSYPILCDPMDCSMPGFPVPHQPSKLAQTHVHWVNDAIQPSRPLSSPSPAFNLCKHQGLFQWVNSLHQVNKILDLQLYHQSFQWIFRTNFL